MALADDPPPALVDNLLAVQLLSHVRFHIAAVLAQVSVSWRDAILHFFSEQRTISIVAKKSDNDWLEAWDRPCLDYVTLVANVPLCTCVELLWWTVDEPMLKSFASWSHLKELLLETCSGITDDGLHALQPLCPRLEKLSLWASARMTTAALCGTLGVCNNLRATTLNLQRYTQMLRHDHTSRARIDGRRVVECIAALPLLCHVALYELEPLNSVDAAADAQAATIADAHGSDGEGPPMLDALAKSKALTRFKIAECLKATARDLASFGGCPSLTLLDWGARSSREAIEALCCGCPRLLDLTLNEESFPIDPRAVEAIARHCPRLTALDLAENRELDDEGVLVLCGRLPSGAPDPTGAGCPELRRLNLSLTDDYEDYDVITVRSRISNRSIGCLCDPRVLPQLQCLNVRGRLPHVCGDVRLLSDLRMSHLYTVQRARRPQLNLQPEPTPP